MKAPAIHHVALSVRDIDKSADWYARLFGLTLVAELEEPAPMKIFMMSAGQALDLRQDPDAAPAPFSQTHLGLDHLCFGCADQAELDGWVERLREFGVPTRGIEDSAFGRHVNFRDPDGIALEFFLAAGA